MELSQLRREGRDGVPRDQPRHQPIVATAKYEGIVAVQRQAGNRAALLLVQRWDPGPMPGDSAPVESAERRHAPAATLEVTVIDDSDIVGWMASFTRTGEIYMVNVRTMVSNVRRAVTAGQAIHRFGWSGG